MSGDWRPLLRHPQGCSSKVFAAGALSVPLDYIRRLGYPGTGCVAAMKLDDTAIYTPQHLSIDGTRTRVRAYTLPVTSAGDVV